MLTYEMVYVITNPIYTFAIYKLLHTFFDDVYDKKIEIFSYFLYTVFLSILLFLTRIPLIIFVFNVISLFLISFQYKSSIQKKIICTSLVYTLLLVIELFVSAGIGFLDIHIYKNSTFHSIVGLILIRTILMIVADFINRYQMVKKKDFPIPIIYYIGVMAILFGTLYLFIVSLESQNIVFYDILIRGTILLVVNIMMICMNEKIYNALVVMYEKHILEQQNIAYENQAEMINQSNASMRALRHDMKNHLIILNEMYKHDKKDEIQPYIAKIIDDMEQEIFSQSNNFVIDSIINVKLKQLKDTDTKISIDVNIPHTIHILAYDITVILGNLLDNAIMAILQSKNKTLNLRISCNKGNLIILLDNSFHGEVIVENGKFKTTKSVQTGHGMGLMNVEKALKQYGGEMQIEYTMDTFSVSVIIPYEM